VAYENIIYSICETAAGHIIASTYKKGLLKYNESKNVFEKIFNKNNVTNNIVINKMVAVSKRDVSAVILITNAGISFVTSDGAIKADSGSLLPQQFFSTACINDNNLWVGSEKGIYKISFTNPAYYPVKITDNDEAVYHIIPDIKNPDEIFYVNHSAKWSKVDINKQQAENFTLPATASAIISEVNQWVADSSGYWLTSQRGFGYYNMLKNSFTNLTKIIAEKSGQSTTRFIVKDDYGKLWVSMRRSGLLVYEPASKKATVLFADTAKPENIFGQTINDMKKDMSGNIYFSCGNKIYKINPASFAFSILDVPVKDNQVSAARLSPQNIYVSPGNRVFVSSDKLIYEIKNDKLVTVYPQKGYSAFSINRLYGDAYGKIFLLTREAMYKTDTGFTKIVNASSWFNYPVNNIGEIHTVSKDKLLVAQTGALGIVQESLQEKMLQPAPVIVSSIKFGNTEKLMVSLQPSKISIDYKDAIELELSSAELLQNAASKILYQLQGWDNGWKELNATSTVRYEQLPPGNYSFIAKAVNTENAESRETIIRFTVVPPFYQRWWFITGIIVLTAVIIFFIYRYRIKKALELERMRTRIATDLHDDIGATLSSISMYSDALKAQVKENMPHLEPVLNKMGESSREMVTGMSDIVWAINPDNDNGEKLLKRMENYATDICAVKNIQLHFSANEKIKQLKLSLEKRKNIYLVFKEAVNNAVKYADAKNIYASISQPDKEVILIIKDDGKGFNEASVKKGNGLKNMQLRADEINAKLQIVSVSGEGTQITLQV
jgi:two-component sensor histidine kinase